MRPTPQGKPARLHIIAAGDTLYSLRTGWSCLQDTLVSLHQTGISEYRIHQGSAGQLHSATATFLVISIGFFLLVALSTSFQSIRNTVIGVDPAGTVTGDFNLSFGDGNVEILTAEDLAELDEEDIEDIEELINFVSEIELPFLSAPANQNLQGFLASQVEANFQDVVDDPTSFFMGSLEYITLFMLLMMPLLALIQQILYITRKRFYVEHFILTLHNHAFLVFSIFLLSVAEIIEELEITLLSSGFSWISTAVVFWIVIYLYLSLKRIFGEGYFVTTLKFVTVSLIYSVCVGVGIMLFFFLLFIFS